MTSVDARERGWLPFKDLTREQKISVRKLRPTTTHDRFWWRWEGSEWRTITVEINDTGSSPIQR
jgi:hypothetical protein